MSFIDTVASCQGCRSRQKIIDAIIERIAELNEQLGEYTAAEANDPKTWPTVFKQMKRIEELEAENERLTALVEMLSTPHTDAMVKKNDERYMYIRDIGIWLSKPTGLRCYRNDIADREIDAAMDAEDGSVKDD